MFFYSSLTIDIGCDSMPPDSCQEHTALEIHHLNVLIYLKVILVYTYYIQRYTYVFFQIVYINSGAK